MCVHVLSFNDQFIVTTMSIIKAKAVTFVTYLKANTVEPPNKGHFGNGPLVLCLEVVPISEVHDFSTHFDCIILNKLV